MDAALVIGTVVLAFCASAVLTPRAAALASRHGALDRPTHRKRHLTVMPLWGGLALLGTMLFTLGIIILVNPNVRGLLVEREGWFAKVVGGVCAGAVLITLIGAADDKWGLPPKVKLLGQIAAAGCLVWGGARIFGFKFPLLPYVTLPAVVGSVVTVAWILVLVNAMNFTDGLDGLAAGVALISSAALAGVSFNLAETAQGWMPRSGLMVAGVLSLILMGMSGGFLLFNFHPAKIFLGDSGSMLLGFLLGSISVIGSLKTTAMVAIILPVLIMALPIFDVVAAIIRRRRHGEPVSKPDKSHVHHRVLALGFSHRGAVWLLYSVNAVLGGFAFWISRP